MKMEFATLKCAVVSLQRGKKTRWEEIQLPNGEEIGEAGAGEYKHLGVLELDKVMCNKMKRKVKEVYQKRVTLPVSSIKPLGYICNKIKCSFLGLDERRDKRT